MRPFHAIEPDHEFVFHIRADIEPHGKGDLGNQVKLVGSRAATIVVMNKGGITSYGVGRCQWEFPFNRKLGREVARGRAKQALYAPPSILDSSYRGRAIPLLADDPKEIFAIARNVALEIINKLNWRARANGYVAEEKALDTNETPA